MAPIKTKYIIARRVKFDIVPNQRLGSANKRREPKSPSTRPITMKTMAVPANENATGYPYRIRMKKKTNMTIASCVFLVL